MQSGNENESLWDGATEAWTLPPHDVWANESRYLYAPYVARGNIQMDLANGYNYFHPDVEWYHGARTRFMEGDLLFLEGMWGRPYFDEGAGNIQMVTFSVPFTRSIPVPQVNPPEGMELPYGLPLNEARKTRQGSRYFWGIATVDIAPWRFLFGTKGTGKTHKKHTSTNANQVWPSESLNTDLSSEPCLAMNRLRCLLFSKAG